MALTESSFVSLKALIASAFEHFVYYITILMLSGVSPSSDNYSVEAYWACSVVVCGTCSVVPYGLTGLLNWLTSD